MLKGKLDFNGEFLAKLFKAQTPPLIGVDITSASVKMVRKTRQVQGYTPKPILFNEDDHFDFDRPQNNFVAAVNEYASWGYFDFRYPGEGFNEGYQSVPVDWSWNASARKRGGRPVGQTNS